MLAGFGAADGEDGVSGQKKAAIDHRMTPTPPRVGSIGSALACAKLPDGHWAGALIVALNRKSASVESDGSPTKKAITRMVE